MGKRRAESEAFSSGSPESYTASRRSSGGGRKDVRRGEKREKKEKRDKRRKKHESRKDKKEKKKRKESKKRRRRERERESESESDEERERRRSRKRHKRSASPPGASPLPRNSPRLPEVSLDAEEKRKKELTQEVKLEQRQERLRKWQEEQAKRKQQEEEAARVQSFNARAQGIKLKKNLSKKAQVDGTDEADEEFPKSKLKFFEALDGELSTGDTNRKDKSAEDEDADPLDAYMVQVEREHGVSQPSKLEKERQRKEQEAIQRAAKEKEEAGQRESEALKEDASKTITLDEILKEAKAKKLGSVSRKEKKEEERFHKRFLEEIQRKKEEEERRQGEIQRNKAKELEEERRLLTEGNEQVAKDEEEEDEGIGLMGGDDGDVDALILGVEKGPSAIELLKEKTRRKEIPQVDHSKIGYISFTKKFYVEAPEIKQMTDAEVALLRNDLEVTIRGAKPHPKPILTWSQCGLNERIMNVLERGDWKVPFPIQRQAIPAIMLGHDIIGVAKTGSGKTLAFVLPMLRHVIDQPLLKFGDGPIALLMAPARELAVQIHTEIGKFAKACELSSTCCYGGVPIRDQIAAVKRGVEIVVATPGRLIELLCVNKGRVFNLRRVTYVVLDEADRMFDMGFEPQVTKIVRNTRPDRQIVMFSATFPPLVERVARELLTHKPNVIVVGGRTRASKNIRHFVEIRQPQDRFTRLLQLLGEWYDEEHQILVFVKSQEACDELFRQLLNSGYECVTLHAGKDQIDRDNTISDFKAKNTLLMVATGVAARGLDVPDLHLVINYDVPNHLEELIHRIGRTGRAGKTGTAFTFLAPDEGIYAPDLVKALKDAHQEIPKELQVLADEHRRKIVAGEAKFRRSGYRGSGFKFTEDEKTDLERQKEILKREAEFSLGLRESLEDFDEDDENAEKIEEEGRTSAEEESAGPDSKPMNTSQVSSSSLSTALEVFDKSKLSPAELAKLKAREKVQQIAQQMAAKRAKAVAADSANIHAEEIVINEYPSKVRYKITHRETIARVTERTGAAVVVKGQYVAPGTQSDDQPLFLLIEGSSEFEVSQGVAEVNRLLEEFTKTLISRATSSSRYKVL